MAVDNYFLERHEYIINNQMEFQKHINGLRAIAVLAVLFYHFKIPGFVSGFVGVDVFLVISGYLMTYILLYGKYEPTIQGLKNFYMNRMRRIVPSVLIVTSATVIVFSTFLLHSDFKKVLQNASSANLFFSNLFFKTQSGYFDTSAETNPLLHTWSLSVEWQFYLIYPLLVLIFKKFNICRYFPHCVIFCIVASFFYGVYGTYLNAGVTYFSTLPRFWEFLIGGLVAIAHANGHLVFFRKIRFVSQPIALLGLLASLYVVDKIFFPGWWALLPVICAAVLVADRSLSVINWALTLRIFQFFGDISYSLYLWHWPVLSYLTMTMGVNAPLGMPVRIGGIVLSIALASLSHRWVEAKIRNKTGFWANKRILLLWATTSVFTLCLLLFVSIYPDEYQYRLPAYLKNADFALRDSNPRRNECFQERDDARDMGYQPYFCRIGTHTSELQAILWGDSFADAIQPAVDKAFLTAGYSGVVSAASGCPPLEAVAYADEPTQHLFKHCISGLGSSTLSFIREHKSIELVMMHANWARYGARNFPHDMANEICALKSSGKRVILIGQVPQPPFDPPRYWAQQQTTQRGSINKIEFNDTHEMHSVFNEVLKATVNKCDGVQVILPKDALCQSSRCLAVYEGRAVFRDPAHLTNSGAMLLLDPIVRFLIRKE